MPVGAPPPFGTLPTSMSAPGTQPGQTTLDSPPPSSALTSGSQSGFPPVNAPGTPPPVPSHQLPPEVLNGMMQAATAMSSTLDSFAQMTPDLAADWALVKQDLQTALSKLQLAGAGPTSPTAPGPDFPGGGLDANGPPRLTQGTGS